MVILSLNAFNVSLYVMNIFGRKRKHDSFPKWPFRQTEVGSKEASLAIHPGQTCYSLGLDVSTLIFKYHNLVMWYIVHSNDISFEEALV